MINTGTNTGKMHRTKEWCTLTIINSERNLALRAKEFPAFRKLPEIKTNVMVLGRFIRVVGTLQTLGESALKHFS